MSQSLDYLVFETLEPQPPSHINEDTMASDLDLWTNAKFTYDITPGHGIMEDSKPAPLDLAQYLNMDMTIAPPPTSSPSFTNTSTRPPTILPKPSLDLFLLPPAPSGTADLVQASKKRQSSDDKSNDDDKRRRNTAASARFRIKKKQKEQAMTQTVRDMTAKVETLQNRIVELETETKWLRGLLLEKNSTKEKIHL